MLAAGVYLLARVVPTTAALAWIVARTPRLSFLSRIPRGDRGLDQRLGGAGPRLPGLPSGAESQAAQLPLHARHANAHLSPLPRAGDNAQGSGSEGIMERERLIRQMKDYALAIQALTRDVSHDQAHWKPEQNAWSIVDVINHLAYEEEHDFRARLDLVLHRPQEAWPSGDPARGVTKSSREPGLERSLDAFLSAREESLAWLQALEAPKWETAYEAPFGQIRAGDILAAWVAHDLLHLRQLIELRWECLTQEVEPYETRYAGPWQVRTDTV